MVDVFHHLQDPSGYLRKLRAYLKPGGRVAIIDFREDSPAGPPKDSRVAPQRVAAEFEATGYRLAANHGFLPNQYFLVFRTQP
jgi:predicted methyltransferase